MLEPGPVRTLATQHLFASVRQTSGVAGTVERAVSRGTVSLAYQPIFPVNAANGPEFYEALLRVRGDSGEILATGDFIDRVEPLELGRTLDCMALEKGISELDANPELTLSVNLSARSLAYPGWLRTLARGLARAENAEGRLILEITEASVMGLPDFVSREMAALRQRGLRFALDDFGAGCTSFRYLKAFRFDVLKIDGQFVRGISANDDCKAMTRAFVDVARHFGMRTVAEMVETPADAVCLSDLGVDYLQGFLLGRPGPRPG